MSRDTLRALMFRMGTSELMRQMERRSSVRTDSSSCRKSCSPLPRKTRPERSRPYAAPDPPMKTRTTKTARATVACLTMLLLPKDHPPRRTDPAGKRLD